MLSYVFATSHPVQIMCSHLPIMPVYSFFLTEVRKHLQNLKRLLYELYIHKNFHFYIFLQCIKMRVKPKRWESSRCGLLIEPFVPVPIK